MKPGKVQIDIDGKSPASVSARKSPGRPLRVLHFVQSSNAGGTETAVLYLCKAMPGETVGAVFKNDGVILPRFAAAEIPTVVLNQAGAEEKLRALAAGSDIIHFHLFTPEPEVERVLSLVDLVPVTTLQWFTRLPVQPHPIVCASSAVAAIQDRANTVLTIHNGVDPDEYFPAPIPRNPRMIVARIGREAKLSVFFKKVAELILQMNDAELWIVGAEGADSGRLRHLGVRHDIPELLRNVDVLVHTPLPRQGAHDMIILEAMSSGVPVVSFDVECVRECIPDTESGCLVPFGDVKAMAARVTELLQDERHRRRMGRAARLTVEERFSSQLMARKYRRAYRWLLGNRRTLPDLDFVRTMET